MKLFGYDPEMGAQTYQIVSGAMAYGPLHTGDVFLLIGHQAIDIPHFDHHLLDECPTYLTHNLTDHSHAIVVQDL